MYALKLRLRQVNTWLIVALLALASWAVDSSRYCLESHETLWAGLGAFASHFWYAMPMTVAIVVLTRLQYYVSTFNVPTFNVFTFQRH